MTQGAYFHILDDFHHSDHSAKMSISFFDDLGDLFLHFGQLSLLG